MIFFFYFFISSQILAVNVLTLSENGYFLVEFLFKSVTFYDSDAQKEPIEQRMALF